MRTLLRFVCLLTVFFGVSHAAGQEKVTYYYADPQGTILATTDAQGNILSTADRKPFGQQVLGSPESGPGFTGHVEDVDTGLTYMQARYYDNTVGRFLSVDPAAIEPGKQQQFGRFTYANNNPILNVDPDGRQTLPPSTYQIDWQSPEMRHEFAGLAISVTPVLGDIQNISNAIDDPTSVNIGIAAIGAIPDVGGAAAKVIKEAGEVSKIGKAASKIDRTAFKAERSAYWKGEATANPSKYSKEDLARMGNGKAPIGPDGHPMELHHVDGTPEGGLTPMSRTDHRLGDNYKDNHPWLNDDK